MTDTYIPQTSASDRYEAATVAIGDTKIMIAMERDSPSDRSGAQLSRLNRILDALIAATPPSVGESEADITYRLYPQVLAEASRTQSGDPGVGPAVSIALRLGVRAGIQYAHERWECEDRPTQEQMLRWLGIKTRETVNDGAILIPEQYIDRED